MDCDRIAAWLPLLLDRELSVWRRLRLSHHVAGCPGCAGRLDELQTMRTAMKERLPYHRAPPGLATRILSSLPREAPPPMARPWFRMSGLALSGSGLAGALAGAALVVLIQGHNANTPPSDVIASVIDSHIGSMMADHLTDVRTSDQHTVKPWLSAHVDVSPPVRELAADGFPLIGGRATYIDGHQVAAVVYRHDKHVINLFAWASPGGGDETLHQTARQGFNVVSWRAGGIAYFAVSDLEADQLMRFARLVREAG